MCMNLYRRIDRKKVQFDFVKHTSQKGDFEEEITKLGGKVFEAPRYKVYNAVQYLLWWKKYLLKHPEYQIIHGHFFTISAIYFSVAKQLGRKTIGHIHASKADGILKKYLVKQITKVTDYPLACSQQAGEWVYGNRPFTVLRNALDTEAFQYNETIRGQCRERLGLLESFAVGTVANYSFVKNPMGLIDIFLYVKKKRPEAKLLWVGEGGLRNNIEERIHTEKIEDDVLLLGARDDVPELLQAMDAFLLPSFDEGLPVSAIEAQASGLPCFISDRVTTETDITGLCHFLPIEKPDIWAEEILKQSITRKDTSEQIKKQGYDIHTTAKWLEEFYLQIEREQGGKTE